MASLKIAKIEVISRKKKTVSLSINSTTDTFKPDIREQFSFKNEFFQTSKDTTTMWRKQGSSKNVLQGRLHLFCQQSDDKYRTIILVLFYLTLF